MTLLQALAGDLADVAIEFWAFDPEGQRPAREAHARYTRLRDSSTAVGAILDAVARQRLQWGVSDGN